MFVCAIRKVTKATSKCNAFIPGNYPVISVNIVKPFLFLVNVNHRQHHNVIRVL